MTTPSSTGPYPWAWLIATVCFAFSAILTISEGDDFDWKDAVTILLFGTTIGWLTWLTFGPRRKDGDPDS